MLAWSSSAASGVRTPRGSGRREHRGEVAVTHAGCCWLTRLHHKQASRWRNYATQLATLLRRTPTPRRRTIPAGRPRAAKTRSYQPVQVECEVDLRPADADTADPSGQVEVQPLGHVILVGDPAVE